MFQIEWTRDADLVALAKKNGMPEGDDCPMDYAEPSDASRYAKAESFEEALAIAKARLPEDMFGEVRIERLVQIRSRYMKDRWDSDAVWHLSDRGDPLKEDDPDIRPEIDLIDDEEIVS